MIHDRNIVYRSKEIALYYGHNRRTWKEFYESERWVFERIAKERSSLGDVLDVGCACGGLGMALSDELELSTYTGIDINDDAISVAKNETKLPVPTRFLAGDIVRTELSESYDTVISLSCADWNIESLPIINACWEKVKGGGYLIVSLRLTTKESVNDISRSYQHINFTRNRRDGEVANYVVFNFRKALGILQALVPAPELIGSYGYWGKPSATAVTPFDELVFAVFYIKKGMPNSEVKTRTELFLPLELFI